MNGSISQTRTAGFVKLLDVHKRHLVYMLLGAAIAAATALIFAVYGWDYYTLGQAYRPFSPKHADLKPSGRLGLRLGITGFVVFALVYLYPLRKRWPALGRMGRTSHWFDYHVLLGLAAPVFVTFHSAFKIHGFAGMAYWTMVALTLSGIVGRYFYAQIPHSIGAAEMSLKEMQELSARLVAEVHSQDVLPASELEKLFHLPSAAEVQSMPLLRALASMTWIDLMRPFKVWALRRHLAGPGGALRTLGGILPSGRPELERAISLAARQTGLAKRILYLSKTQRVFLLWHVIHRPFSLSFAAFLLIHVGVVIFLGYY